MLFNYNIFIDSQNFYFQMCLFTGKQNELVALLLVPLCIKTTKQIKINDATINVCKEDVSKCFILHIKVKTSIKLFQ